MRIEILYQDEAIVAVNKPPRLPSHATADPLRPHLQGLVEKQLGESLVLFHRLDLDTTGVVLFGRDPSINRVMTEAFRDRQMTKTYHAVVNGRWLPEWTEVRTYIKKISGGRWANLPKGKGGDPAISNFRVIKTNALKTYVEVQPQTGRTHQIRLHCLERGHPILGDKLYGRAHPQDIPMALHARALEFTHPIKKAALRIEAPLPSYWQEFWLKDLEKRL
ncbi:MAG: RluA family pseudouridine synthase [Bdellovibrionales bacterium]|nr:RluA family pseudouridine synthase [Bdellovibrionales bacterium]